MNKEELIALIDEGRNFEYLFFLSHKEKTLGILDEACLSQWYPSPFIIQKNKQKLVMPTAEHYMMYSKAMLFKDFKRAKQILETKEPREVLHLGRRVQNFDENIWRALAYTIVVEGNLAKFSQNPKLQSYLLATKDKVLVEASKKDKTWGIGLLAEDKNATNPKKWLGKNQLGFALMQVRALLG
jgi:ribA/ribD-fused uncharacterized protein